MIELIWNGFVNIYLPCTYVYGKCIQDKHYKNKHIKYTYTLCIIGVCLHPLKLPSLVIIKLIIKT